jgi:hypothetical protein
MANAAAAGIPPWRFWDLTPRELYAAFKGAKILQKREYRRSLFGAWQLENLARTKRMPRLDKFLSKFDPVQAGRKMTQKAVRQSIFAINRAMGGKVTFRKRAEAKPKE